MHCLESGWKLVVMLMMKCSLQVCAVPRVKLEVHRDVDDEVLIAGVCST